MYGSDSYLNYYKLILQKVKFDPQLFWKEYQKAMKVLSNSERSELKRWMQQQYVH